MKKKDTYTETDELIVDLLLIVTVTFLITKLGLILLGQG